MSHDAFNLTVTKLPKRSVRECTLPQMVIMIIMYGMILKYIDVMTIKIDCNDACYIFVQLCLQKVRINY